MAVLPMIPRRHRTFVRNHCVSPLTFSNMTPACAVDLGMPAPEICSRVAQPSSRCKGSSTPRSPGLSRRPRSSDRRRAGTQPRRGLRHRLSAAQSPRAYGGSTDRQGAGIKVFKKIGDRVEQGEPLYRIYAFAGLSERIAERTIPAAQIFLPVLDDIYELSTSAPTPIDVTHRRRLAPEAVVALDWHNDMSKLILDLNEHVEAAADDRARGVIIRRVRRALEAEH